MTIPADERVILALDVDDRDAAMRLVESTLPALRYVKVGWQLFLGAGTSIVHELAGAGLRVFLDLKVGDVDNTVRMAAAKVAQLPVELMTLNGNAATVAAAVAGRGERTRPQMLLVTLLSSWDASDLDGGPSTPARDVDVYAARRALAAVEAGAGGVIASGNSVAHVRQALADRNCLIVTPGVRPASVATDEHKRVLTPGQAIRLGADYLVVGRPVRSAPDPRAALARIIDEVDGELATEALA